MVVLGGGAVSYERGTPEAATRQWWALPQTAPAGGEDGRGGGRGMKGLASGRGRARGGKGANKRLRVWDMRLNNFFFHFPILFFFFPFFQFFFWHRHYNSEFYAVTCESSPRVKGFIVLARVRTHRSRRVHLAHVGV